jgi:hypothetical protein
LEEVLVRGSRATEDAHGRLIRVNVGMTEAAKEAMTRDLELMLDDYERHEIPPTRFAEVTLDDPVLLLLAQHRSFRICRSHFFCPVEDCDPFKPITSLGRLAIHLQTFHGVSKEETADMMRYFIMKLLPGPVKEVVTTLGGHRVKGKRCLCRCHSPGCTYVSGKEYQVSGHVHSKHKAMANDIKRLGWFWGTMHTMLKAKPDMTIAEALGQGDFWECTADNCHMPFQSEKALRQHFTQAHAAYVVEGWEARSRKLVQKWSQQIGDSDGTNTTDEARGPDELETRVVPEMQSPRQVEDRDEDARAEEVEAGVAEAEREAALRRVRVRAERRKEVKDREERERGRRRAAELRRAAEAAEEAELKRDLDLRVNPRLTAERVRQEQEKEERRMRCREYIRKKEQYERYISRGVNIPQLNTEQMRKVKEGLSDLFKGELNPLLEQMMSRTDGHEEWVGFEGAYEECMHRICEHILLAIGRDLNGLYGERRLNPKVQAAAEKSTEVVVSLQKVRRDLKKLEDILHTIEEAEEGTGDESDEGFEMRRRQAKFTKRIGPILNLLSPEAIEEQFNSRDHEEIWRELNTQENRRGRVIDWLDAMITIQVEGEILEMNKRALALKVQEAYRTSKGIAMRRFIDKEQSHNIKSIWTQ